MVYLVHHKTNSSFCVFLARNKAFAGPGSVDVPRIRSALGELSNTIGKKKRTVERKQLAKLPVENLFETKFRDKTANSVKENPKTVPREHSCHPSESPMLPDLDSFGEIESMPHLYDNEEEECEEFVWPKKERLFASDLNYLCSWIPSQRPRISDIVRIDSSEEAIDEMMLISPENPPKLYEMAALQGSFSSLLFTMSY